MNYLDISYYMQLFLIIFALFNKNVAELFLLEKYIVINFMISL